MSHSITTFIGTIFIVIYRKMMQPAAGSSSPSKSQPLFILENSNYKPKQPNLLSLSLIITLMIILFSDQRSKAPITALPATTIYMQIINGLTPMRTASKLNKKQKHIPNMICQQRNIDGRIVTWQGGLYHENLFKIPHVR